MTLRLTGPDAGAPPRASPDEFLDGHAHDGSTTTMPAALYQRMVRVVSYLFIASVAAIVTLTGGPNQAAVYVLLVVGIVLLVLFQDVLSTSSLGRWRVPLEGAAVILFLTILVALTSGFESPFFFGYVLLVGAGSLWATGIGPPLLAGGTAVAYLLAVIVGSRPTLFTVDGVGRVAFNVLALGLVTYVAWVIGREQRRAREEALRLSRFDSLTNLHSRAFLASVVEREIPRAARTGRPFAMAMIDLDGLKAANDRFGHDSGDKLLQAVADVLRGDIRVTDVAARYAGDEFVLLLPETDIAGALRVADKVRVDISRLALPHDGQVIRTSASIGLVTYPDDGRTWAELMRRADLAMYEAKRRGRDQIVRYAREPAATPAMAPAAAPTPMPPPPPQIDSQPPPPATPPPVAPTPAPTNLQIPGPPFIPAETPYPAPWEVRTR
jgi:diguanylate cyclase (GGDEF)-like protein